MNVAFTPSLGIKWDSTLLRFLEHKTHGLISNFVGHRRVRSSDLLDAVVRIPLTRLVLVAVRHDGVAVVVLQRPHPVLENARGAAYLGDLVDRAAPARAHLHRIAARRRLQVLGIDQPHGVVDLVGLELHRAPAAGPPAS